MTPEKVTPKQSELEKRVEEAASEYASDNSMPEDYHNNHHDGLEFGFKAGAKFILEMPELKEAVRLVKAFYNAGDDTYCTCGVELGSEESWKDPECLYHESKSCLSKLRELGVV